MLPQRLVLFVEGKGDIAAVPAVVRKVLRSVRGEDALFVDDEDPFRVSGVGSLVKEDCRNWRRWLESACRTRKNVGAVLLVLDGDADRVPPTWAVYSKQYQNSQFCAYRVAAMLAHQAKASRAGEAFSLGIVFAMKEFEAWLVGGIESLRGQSLAQGRGIVPANAAPPKIELEAKRDAKGILRDIVPAYDPSLDQGVLAKALDVSLVGQRCRSFRRLESAIAKLVDAVRAGKPAVNPLL